MSDPVEDGLKDVDLGQWLAALADHVADAGLLRRIGTVQEVVGLTIMSQGPPAQVGESCYIRPAGDKGPVPAEVVGFRDRRVLLMPLGDIRGIQPGCQVVATGRQLSVPVGSGLLGRVIDGFGRPLDGRGRLPDLSGRPLHSGAPRPMERARFAEPMHVGIRSIDTLLTCAKGQRMGIFAGSGVGKSVLLGMVARNSTADVNVIALVGERGREVLDFVEGQLQDALERSVVVVATADEPALMRLHAGVAATVIAEEFRDRGAHVMLMMDSLTRLARAQREIGLAAGELPVSRGYPPSVFAGIPMLVERAGPSPTGTITGIYTVLVEGDDMLEPVADIARATLDGHIVLSRALAEQGQYPAVDVNASLSRAMTQVVDRQHIELAEKTRRLLRAYADIADLVAVGAYEPGGDPWLDAAVAVMPSLSEFLRQDTAEKYSYEHSMAWLQQIVSVADSIMAGEEGRPEQG